MVHDFTIIIPTYNEERTIRTTLEGIKKQRTRASVKVVVVDGGSTDRTVEVAKQYVPVLRSPKQGKAHQLNYAASKTKSKYLIFLDADTLLPPNYVDRIQTEFENDQNLWACAAQILYRGRRSGIWHTFVILQAIIDFTEFAFVGVILGLLKLLPYTHFKILQINYFYNISMFIYYNLRQLVNFTEFSGANICIRRKVFEEIGGFRQPPKLGVDMLFCRALRGHIRKKKAGKMKTLLNLFVETDVRHLETVRSLKRLGQHRS
ncbi:MAG: glycosyltransferase family 2 protein [Promethearchaeota archaeon]|nr:MAG: glycosyltransferase family 2 protein [Candidatus Lokiarchaeota archaeon]